MPHIVDWISELSLKDSLQILGNLSSRHALQGGEHGARINDLIQRRDYAALVAYELPQNDYGWDVLQLIHCRQALAFFSKLEPLEIGIDKERVAYEAFVKSEDACRQTNLFFLSIASGRSNLCPDLARVLYAAKRKIAWILGKCPSVSQLQVKFGPGSTTSIKKEVANPQRKFAEQPTCSDDLAHSAYIVPLLATLPHWLDCHSEEVIHEGDRYSMIDLVLSEGQLQFVPKNAKTYRCIDVQPTLNTLFQGGIGRYMSDRLKRAGIDITDQTLNQRRARTGSLSNSLCTIDLQSASDTVSTQLVKFLLDDEWYSLLRSAGCSVTSFNGSSINLEKFSSMGNGYTFPLETLIFWSLTASACEGNVGRVTAYGDDIICPSESYEQVCRVLSCCGFVVNRRKSFHDGPFRESCGADWYLGFDVRPYYQKRLVSGETLFTLHNYYYRSFQTEMCDEVLKCIPSHLQRRGPDGYFPKDDGSFDYRDYGDGHLLSQDWEWYRTRELRRSGYGGVFFKTYSRTPVVQVSLYPGDYVTPLYNVYVAERSSDFNKYFTNPGRGVEFVPDGRPLWGLPGTDGYVEQSIYTFLR